MTTTDDPQQNEWFENKSRGRKARSTAKKKSQHVKKKSYQRPLADMLRTAKKLPQAILKITSYAKDKGQIQAHLIYISRHAKLQLEDEKGQQIQSKQEQEELLAEWETSFSDRKNSRHTAHMMLSTPEGTPPEKARQAAKDFLAKEFGKKHVRYLFVMHEDTKHPHIHVVLNMYPTQGKKLNINPKNLYELRAKFAKACRDQGIQVDASLRWERGLAGKAEKSQLVQMKREGRVPEVDKKLVTKIKEEVKQPTPEKHPSEEKIRKRNQLIHKYYIDKAKELHQQRKEITNPTDKARVETAVQVLHQFAKDLPLEKTRSDKIKIAFEKANYRQDNRHSRYPSKTEKRFEQLAEQDYQLYAKDFAKELKKSASLKREKLTNTDYLDLYQLYQSYQEKEREKGMGLEKEIHQKE